VTAASEQAARLASRLKFGFGDKVYPVCGNQIPGLVTAIELYPGGILYNVTWGGAGDQKRHYDFELSSDQSVLES
jgi:hypothetical protein